MATKIDFEDLPLTTVVMGQYQKDGVIVNGGEILGGAETAYSGQKYLSARAPTDVGDPLPLTFTFPTWAKSVSLYAGAKYGGANTTVPTFASLTAFDSTHTPITRTALIPVGNTCHTHFSVSRASFDITSVTLAAFGIDAGNLVEPMEVIDYLEFEPGPPISAPVIEHGLYELIFTGLLGEPGHGLGPHGGPVPVPPIGPGERAILAAFVTNGVAQMIGDVESRRAIQRAALGVIAREANRLSERL